MTGSAPNEIRVGDKVFFGVTSAVGTPIELSVNALRDELVQRGYESEQLRLSKLSSTLQLPTQWPIGGSEEYKRIRFLMDCGNDARRVSERNDVLAMLAISKAIQSRSERGDDSRATAVIFRQLKHPDEAYRLREVYDEGFHLIGIHCPRDVRLQQLEVQKGMSPQEALELAGIDEDEGLSHGQHVRDTFHLSDVFIRATGDAADSVEVRKQLSRFCGLLFGDGFHTPTIDEYGMFLAWASGLRSGQLSRQVGAAILSPQGEVLSLGTNEVPRGGGGQYWEGLPGVDGRDHKLPRGDSTDYMRRDILSELLDVLQPGWRGATAEETDARLIAYQQKLKSARAMNLTEFTRAVHAEMEALSAAVRVGISVRGATLYTTTFPCHNCTKHIVAAGVARVVYIEPYPKSMAYDLHNDSITIDKPGDPCGTTVTIDKKVNFQAFVGIAPRRYADLFAMTTKDGRIIRRKDKMGLPVPNVGLRLRLQVGSFMDREAIVASEIAKLATPGGQNNG